MRMNRRNVLLGIGGLAALAGGAIGTGAFSQVTAERSAEVSVATDANAYLSLDATNNSSPLVGQTSTNGTIAFDFSGGTVNSTTTVSGSGLNPEATTAIPQAFEIANHGTDGVGVKAVVSEYAGSPTDAEKQAIRDAITFEYTDGGGTTYDLLWDGTGTEWVPFDVGQGGWVDVTFDLDGTGLTGDLVNNITFQADASQF